MAVQQKICSKCGGHFPLEDFTKDASTRDGRRGRCRSCTRAAANRQTAARRSSGKCTQCGLPHAGQGACCPRCLERHKDAYVNRDPEICWLCRSPDLITALYCESCWLKEASKRFLGSRARGPELKELLVQQGFRCALTGVPLRFGQNASVDHIIPRSQGGADTLENYRWVHTRINGLRGDLADPELYDLCLRVVEISGKQSCGRDPTWLGDV